MSVIKFIEQIENDLLELKQKGQLEVDIDKLLAYLSSNKDRSFIRDEIEKCEMEIARDKLKFQHEHELEDHKSDIQVKLSAISTLNQSQSNMSTAILETAQTALKGSILINGGAAIAVLAFIGNVWSVGINESTRYSLLSAVSFFSYGALAGAVAGGLRYISQHIYFLTFQEAVKAIYDSFSSNKPPEFPKNNKMFIGDRVRDVAIIFAIVAYVCFYLGIRNAGVAFNIHFSSLISAGL